MKTRAFFIAGLIALLCLPSHLMGASQTIRLPVTLDYSFLHSIFVRQAFTQAGERAVPVNIGNGCTIIELWQPQVGPEASLLKIGSNIKIQAGLPLSGQCMKLSESQGFIEVLQHVRMDEKSMRLGFETEEFRFFNQQGQRTDVDRVLTELIRTYVNPHLNQVGLDFAAPVKGLQALLPLFFTGQDRSQLESGLGGLRLGQVNVGPNAIGLDMLLDLDVTPARGRPAGPAADPAPVIKAWEDWDAFAVHQIETLVGQLLTDDERSGLLGTLLDTRHEFVDALTEGILEPDLIRRQFTSTWQTLSPILRKHLTGQPSGSLLNYLAYFITSDALATLDRAGPGLNLSVSRDGLLRLARLLRDTGPEPTLDYSYAVNQNLRTLLNLGPPLNESGPAFNFLEMDLPEEPSRGMIPTNKSSSLAFLPSSAFAAEGSASGQAEIQQWLLPKGDITPYLDRVKLTLNDATTQVLSKSALDEKMRSLYRLVVLATAWQETCWRQFTRTAGKVRCMVSYNQTSVGLMQINERVWRGIYRSESLRWNIAYNARAGCEILDQYLRRYALKKPESRTMDADTLARAVYAMYNGGPGQFAKFLARSKNDTFNKIDSLFWEKYAWTKSDHLDQLSHCLTGR